MREETRDGGSERTLLIAAITNTAFLARLAIVGKDPWRSRWSNLVWSWIKDYFLNYNEAPGKNLIPLFETWSASNKDKDLHTLVHRFLSSLSEEYDKQESTNLGFTLDLAGKYLNEVKAERLQEEIKTWLDRGIPDKAVEAISTFRKITLKMPSYIDVLKDKSAQRRSLEARQQILVKYPGAAGEFFGSELSEDSFVAFMAPMKGKKSYMLFDIGWTAMKQGRKVAYFQVGDLSENQILRRFHKRAAYRPIEACTIQFPKGITLPIGSRSLAVVDQEEKIYKSPIDWVQAETAFAKMSSKSKGEIRLSSHPIRLVSIVDIKGILERWDDDGWQANVVIIDYAANLAPIEKGSAGHEATAETWAIMRQLSEIRKCLVVTANQTNKEGFRSWVLTRSHFADSKMILAHCTAFYGINATNEETSRGIVRINPVVVRDSAFTETDCLYCATCLAIGNPIVCSTLRPQ